MATAHLVKKVPLSGLLLGLLALSLPLTVVLIHVFSEFSSTAESGAVPSSLVVNLLLALTSLVLLLISPALVFNLLPRAPKKSSTS